MTDFRYPSCLRRFLLQFIIFFFLWLITVALPPSAMRSAFAIATEPDLALIQSVDHDPVAPGDDVVYILRYENVGTSDATGVVITEIVPDHTTANLASNEITAGWQCPAGVQAGSVCTLDLAPVFANSAGAIKFVVTVIDAAIPSGAEMITNTAEITFDPMLGDDPTPENNSTSATIALDARPDLAIEKSDGGVTAKPGETLVYTLTVTNNGTQTAAGVEVIETIPAHTSYGLITVLYPWACPNNNAGELCTLSIGELESGASQSVQFVVLVDSSVPLDLTSIDNQAIIGDDGLGGVDPTDNNSATTQTLIDVLPVLALDKSDNDADVIPGEVITYTLTITNSGAQAAHNVMITETVPAATKFVGPAGDWDCSAGDPAGTVCSHILNTLDVNQPVNVQFLVQVLDPLPDGVTEIENIVLICGGGLPDTLEDIEITPLTTPPDLSLNKSTNQSAVEPGEVLVYTLDYTNQGGRPAPNSIITETIPENTTFNQAGSTPGWLCTPNQNANSTCTFNLGTVAAGASASVRFAVQVNTPLTSGVTQIDNRATISNDRAQGADSNPLDNHSSISTPVNAAPDLTLTKHDGDVTATSGQTIIYDLAYANVGNQAATGVFLRETVPAHTTFDASESHPAWSCANGGVAGDQCTFALGTLLVGDQGSVRFAVNVDSLLPVVLTPLINQAQIDDDHNNGADLAPNDNRVSLSTPLKAAPDLQIKTDDQGLQATPGSQITYRLTYTNVGSQAAPGVMISSTVPAHTVFVGPANQWDCPAQSPAGTLCTAMIGLLSAKNQGAINFVVQVAEPLPANVDEVRNIAQIGNPSEPYGSEDQASTPINAAPELRLRKSDGDATVEPGQVVVYVLGYENQGNQAATGVVVTEQIPANTSFIANLSSPTWVCTESICTYAAGDLDGGESGQVEFAVRIDNGLRAVTTKVDNRAQIADDQHNGVDPLPDNNIATDSTEIALALALHATMRAQLVGDADQNGVVSPGDTLEYVAEIVNRGNRQLTAINFVNPLDPNIKMAGDNAVQTSSGSVQTGNQAQDRTVQIQVNSLSPSAKITITFRVVINQPLAADVTLIEQQGTVASNEAPTITTDDPASAGANDRTKTPVTLEPILRLTKLDFLFEDADNNDKVSSGDKILYSIKVVNVGNATAADVVLSDTPDSHTTLVTGKVQSSRGAILSGNRSGDTAVQIEIGSLAVGESAQINLLVIVKPNLTTSQFANQASVMYMKAGQKVSALSDDPATAEAQDPTVTPINRPIEDTNRKLYLPAVRKG